ncbi:hypothetical protein [Streptomyces noursei]|uniref:Uncharacterized protein n=1 Tax=Streptomyces noursei TaxID=1971 RepID=A0A2N8PKR7_STRNR|nr:hypothetical protein [Streptomyces noursei]PNE41608.1 hypothetical protein AOB60_13350 [Streptomyces noursei]
MVKATRGNENGAAAESTPDTGKLTAQPKKPSKVGKSTKPGRKKSSGTAGKQPRARRSQAAMGPVRWASYQAGRFSRKHTSPVTRQRLRAVTGGVRAAGRAAARWGNPVLARVWRYGSRGLLNAHMVLGSIRYSTIGPNWLRPLAKVLHIVYSPAARMLAWAGTWGWLNRWMYQHTSHQPTRSTPPRRSHRPASAPHRTITSPGRSEATVNLAKGVAVSGLEHTSPLRYAAETVRAAGAMMVLNPAHNMVGYEATIRALVDVQRAIGDVIHMAAINSRENFRVNEAIPEAYDDTAVYAHALAGRLESIPTLFRIIHAEQIDNIENPTPQGAKWDQSANQQ